MNNGLLEKQKREAQRNFNYFFMVMITKIIKVFIVLTCVLLFHCFINILLVKIISLVTVMISISLIYKIIDRYRYILNDIKKTFNNEEFIYIIDTNIARNLLLRKLPKYGK